MWRARWFCTTSGISECVIACEGALNVRGRKTQQCSRRNRIRYCGVAVVRNAFMGSGVRQRSPAEVVQTQNTPCCCALKNQIIYDGQEIRRKGGMVYNKSCVRWGTPAGTTTKSGAWVEGHAGGKPVMSYRARMRERRQPRYVRNQTATPA